MRHIMLRRRWIPSRKTARCLHNDWRFPGRPVLRVPVVFVSFGSALPLISPLPAHQIFCYGFRSCLRLGLTYITLINKGWRAPRMSHYGISPVTEPTGFNWESSIPASVLSLARSPSGLFLSLFSDEGAWHFALNPLCREPGMCQLTKKFVPFQCFCCKTQIQAICVWAQNWVDLRRHCSPLFAQSFFPPLSGVLLCGREEWVAFKSFNQISHFFNKEIMIFKWRLEGFCKFFSLCLRVASSVIPCNPAPLILHLLRILSEENPLSLIYPPTLISRVQFITKLKSKLSFGTVKVLVWKGCVLQTDTRIAVPRCLSG